MGHKFCPEWAAVVKHIRFWFREIVEAQKVMNYLIIWIELTFVFRIHPAFWHYLNLDVPITSIKSRYDPYNLISPQSCAIDIEWNPLFFKTLKYNPSVDYTIVNANPFTLLKKNSGLYCTYKYVEPTWLYFALKRKSVLNGWVFMILPSNMLSCFLFSKMIYCYPHRIKFDSNEVDCPNNVMSIQNNVVVTFPNKSLFDVPSHYFGHIDHYKPVQVFSKMKF